MKKKDLLMIISILSLIVIVLGSTFSYFAAFIKSNNNYVSISAGSFGAKVIVSSLYNDKSLIPLNDDDVMIAYNNQCVDMLNRGACYGYNIAVTNLGDEAGYTGTINFNIDDIEHLNYMLLDDANNVYLEKNAIVSNSFQSLGNSFILDTGETKNFKLIIWLSNFNYPQDDEDAGGNFSASVTYESTYGSRITGTFSVS